MVLLDILRDRKRNFKNILWKSFYWIRFEFRYYSGYAIIILNEKNYFKNSSKQNSLFTLRVLNLIESLCEIESFSVASIEIFVN